MNLTPVQREAFGYLVGSRLWMAYDGTGVAGRYPRIERRFTRRTMRSLIRRGLIHMVLPYAGSSAWPYIPIQIGPGWGSGEVQRIYMQLVSEDQAQYDEGLDRLRAVLDDLPDLTWRQKVSLEVGERYWRFREFVQRAWLAL